MIATCYRLGLWLLKLLLKVKRQIEAEKSLVNEGLNDWLWEVID